VRVRRSPLAGTFNFYFWTGLLVSLVGLSLQGLIALKSFTAWDDAYMFIRYADNLLEDGRIAWNLDGPATYGPTSLLYLLVVVPLRLANVGNPLATLLQSSLLCGVGFLLLLLWLLLSSEEGKSYLARVFLLLVLLLFLGAREDLLFHFLSGMDTTFAMLYLTVFIAIWRWHTSASSRASTTVAGVVGGLAFWARPDLLLYAVTVPAAFALLSPAGSKERSAAARVLAIVLGTTALLVFLSWQVLESPLPLSFYCKSFAQYGAEFQKAYSKVPGQQLFAYLGSYWLLFLAVAASLLLRPRSWLDAKSALALGLLVATAGYLLYYLLFVTQVMYYRSRFYYPTLPALVWVGFESVRGLANRVEERWRGLSRIPRTAWIATAVLLAVASGAVAVGGYSAHLYLDEANLKNQRPTTYKWGWTDILNNKKRILGAYWYALDEVSTMPDDLVIAATEIGYLSVMNPRKRIIDITGLNNTIFAHDGFDPEVLFRYYRPDFVYMPHFNYKQMTRLIEEDPTFKRDYVYVRRERLDRAFGIAYRKDSRYADRIRRMLP
jgi:hypothetical protein